MKTTKEEFAIIILNYNSGELTAECAEKLREIGISNDIFIIDNKSEDNSFETLTRILSKANNVYILQTASNSGYAAGNNFGVKEALKLKKYKYMVIMNPDVYLESNYLNKHVDFLEAHEDVAGISSLMFSKDSFQTASFSWDLPTGSMVYKELFLPLKSKYPKKTSYKRYEDEFLLSETLPGSMFMIRTDDFASVGFFDEHTFLYNEENILGQKIKELGKVFVIDSGNHYIHNHKEYSKSEVIERYKYSFKNIRKDLYYNYQSRGYYASLYAARSHRYILKMVYGLNVALINIKRFKCILMNRMK